MSAAADHLLDRGVVVRHLERAETLAAHPRRRGRVLLPAQMTRQTRNESHFLISRTRTRPLRCWPRDAGRVMHGQRPHGGLAGRRANTSSRAAAPAARSSAARSPQSTDRRPTGTPRARRDPRATARRPAAARASSAPAGASDRGRPRAAARSPCVCSACTSESTRCMLKMASRRCRWSGSAARAFAVASPTDGVATTRRSSSGQVQCSASGACPSSATTDVRPPKSAGAALSAWPSSEVAAASSSRSDSGCGHLFEQSAARPPWPRRCCPARPPSECRSPPRRARSAS